MEYKYKILIVTDEEDELDILVKYLEREGYKVEATRNATDALEKIKSTKCHIVLIEIEIPQMGGLELLREIKKYDSMTQIIMMTELSTIDKILGSLEFGANDYIYKPFKSMEYVQNVINYSIQKLERWKSAIIQIII